MQTLFLRGPSVTFRAIILVIASIGLMTLDHRQGQMEMVRNTLSYILYPLQYTIDLPIRMYHWTGETLRTQEILLNENNSLKDQQLENQVRLQKLDILEEENNRLRELLHATPKTGEEILIAEIINVDVDPYRQLTVINKGSNDNVYISQPVIDAQGVIGQTIHVNATSSTVMLITDASHALPVQVDRTGMRAVAFGTGKINYLDLRHIPHNADIRQGDTLITSGLGGRFTANNPVAVITDIKRSPDEAFVTVIAEPLALLDRSREVLLVWYNQPQIKKNTNDGS
jgi:rod shape-determining protein MreC